MQARFFNRPIKDKVALSAISGAFGTLVMYGIGLPLYLLKVSKLVYLIYVIELFVTPQIARSTPGLIAGMLTGILVGAALALGFKVFLEWTGVDWFWLKALGYGFTIWFLWVGLTRNLLDIASYISTDLTTNLILLMQSIIYAGATAFFMLKLGGGPEELKVNDK